MMATALAGAEQARKIAQVVLDGQKSAQRRNQLGQFSTPPDLAVEMAKLGRDQLPVSGPIRFLDPAVGTGVFFYAAREVFGARIKTAWGYETDPVVAEKARELWVPFGLDVRVENFCGASAPKEDKQKANLILCNPPYVRHQHLNAEQKLGLQSELKKAGFSMSGLGGLYNYFVLLSHKWLSQNGIAIWLIPAEFMDVNYGKSVKEYLTRDVSLIRLHRFSPENIQFSDALVSSVIVIFRIKQPSATCQVDLTSGGTLASPQLVRTIPTRLLLPRSKWGPLFTGASLNVSHEKQTLTIGDLFQVKRGLATGANDFFILKREQAEGLQIPAKYLRPILPSPREIPGEVVESNGNGFPLGIPELVLLDCDLPMDEICKNSPALFAYLERGKQQGIPDRYLAAHRRVWYSQEVRPPAPILCTYMGRNNGGRALRFIRNKSGATAQNVYLVLYPKPCLASILRTDPEAIERVFDALGEVSKNLAQGGRVYGGGLYKIEPKELERVNLPQWLEHEYPTLVEFQLSID